jgi:hypothetical protein
MNETSSASAPSAAATSPAEVMRHLAYGEAAVLLVECLMHVLIEHRILTSQDMVSAVESALAAKRQMVKEGEHAEIAAIAAGTLSVIANSVAAARPASMNEQAKLLYKLSQDR